MNYALIKVDEDNTGILNGLLQLHTSALRKAANERLDLEISAIVL